MKMPPRPTRTGDRVAILLLLAVWLGALTWAVVGTPNQQPLPAPVRGAAR